MYDESLRALKYLAGAKPKSKFAIALGIGANQAVMEKVIDKLTDQGYIGLADINRYMITRDGIEKVKSQL